MRVIVQPGMTVKLAPLGAHDLGEPRPCLVHHDPASLAPYGVVCNEACENLTSHSDDLAALAERHGLVVSPALYVP